MAELPAISLVRWDERQERVAAWRSKAALLLGRGLLRVLARTWRIRVVNGDTCGIAPCGHTFIFALWHGQLLPCSGIIGRGSTCSDHEHRDGELVARTAQSSGMDSSRIVHPRCGTRAHFPRARASGGTRSGDNAGLSARPRGDTSRPAHWSPRRGLIVHSAGRGVSR